MKFQFKEITNQDKIYNNDSINYFSNLAINSNENAILDFIFDTLKLTNKKDRRDYLFELKDYYSNKGIILNDDEFEEHVNSFLNDNIGNVKGGFLEVLIYKLLNKYCLIDKIYKECIVKYVGDEKHPYDIVTLKDQLINLIDIKFSCTYLKKTHLDYLIEFKHEEDVKAYLVSLDTLPQMLNSLNILKSINQISDDEYEFYMKDISFISKNEIYNSILNKKCLIN